jgi:hypothetical protein
MKPRRVRRERAFDEALRKLPRELQEATIAAVGAFINRSRERALRPERKQGAGEIWAFRVTSAVRVFYVQDRDESGRVSVLFHVGRHDDYRSIIRRRPK